MSARTRRGGSRHTPPQHRVEAAQHIDQVRTLTRRERHRTLADLTGEHQRVVVGNQDPQRRGPSSTRRRNSTPTMVQIGLVDNPSTR
jgi:hypothetical protein